MARPNKYDCPRCGEPMGVKKPGWWKDQAGVIHHSYQCPGCGLKIIEPELKDKWEHYNEETGAWEPCIVEVGVETSAKCGAYKCGDRAAFGHPQKHRKIKIKKPSSSQTKEGSE